MAIELRVPSLGESITEVFIGEWRKQVGQQAASGENLVEIESDKATVELAAPQAGVVATILKKKGDTAAVGEVIGYLDAVGAGADGAKPAAPQPATAPAASAATPSPGTPGGAPNPAFTAPGPAAAAVVAKTGTAVAEPPRVMPAAARELGAYPA